MRAEDGERTEGKDGKEAGVLETVEMERMSEQANVGDGIHNRDIKISGQTPV